MEQDGHVDVSVILCTYNRARQLSDALARLAAQDTASLSAEIIVVDNNSTDDTPQVVHRAAGASPIPVHYHFEPTQGVSYARNAGAAAARGSILAFTDDDVLVTREWVGIIRDAFDAAPGVDCVGGKVLPLWPAGPPRWLTRDHWTPLAVLDYGDAPLPLDRPDGRCLIGANIAFRREAFRALGGFCPSVQRVRDGIGSIEDHEFLLRFWNHRMRALYVPELVAIAPVEPLRMGKRYHRRWHSGNGRFHAIMRAPDLEASGKGRLFDVPLHLYRQFGADAAGWARHALTGRLDAAFLHETRLRFFCGFFAKRRRDFLAAGSKTTLADLRAPVVHALRHVDDRLVPRRGVPRQVMFEAANPMLFEVFRPVCERLAADPRVSIALVPHGTEFGPAEIFGAAARRHRVIRPARAAWLKPDVYISTDLWSMTWLHRRTGRVHMFHGVAGKYGLDAPTDLAPALRTFDRVLFPNRDRLERYVGAGLVARDAAVLTGYPKADCLVDGSLDRSAIRARLRLDPAHPTILYAPTWSAYSSLTAGHQVIAALAGAGVNVIVKLHACSYTPRGAGGVDWRHELRAHADRPNVRVVHEADASPYLVAADLLVTDHSTVGFEFMLLDRPIVVLHQPALVEHARINPEKVALLQSAARVVHEPASLADAAREELRRPARLSAARRRIAEEMFFRPGDATASVAAVIYELLDLPAEAGSHGVRTAHGIRKAG